MQLIRFRFRLLHVIGRSTKCTQWAKEITKDDDSQLVFKGLQHVSSGFLPTAELIFLCTATTLKACSAPCVLLVGSI